MNDGSAAPPPNLDRPEERQRRNLALLVIGLVTLPSCNAMLPVYGTRIREYLTITAEQFGTLMGLKSLGQIPALFTVGLLVARLGVRRVAEFSAMGVGTGFLILGLGGNLLSFQVSMPTTGLFLGFFSIALPSVLISLFPALKRRIFSVMLVASAAPSILTPLLANEFLKWSAGRGDTGFTLVLQLPFLIAGTSLVLGGLLLVVAKKTGYQAELERTHQIRFRSLLRPRPLTIVLLLSLHAAADNTLYYFLPMFMENHFEQLPLPSAWVVSGHGLAYVVTRSILSFWPEGKGHRVILSLAGPLGGAMVILTLWFGPAVSVPFLYTLASMMFAAEYPVLVSEVSSESLAEFGSILAGGRLGSEVISFSLLKGTGRIADLTGDYRVALSTAACGFVAFGLIATLAGLGIRLRSKPSPDH